MQIHRMTSWERKRRSLSQTLQKLPATHAIKYRILSPEKWHQFLIKSHIKLYYIHDENYMYEFITNASVIINMAGQ
jgi:hypothetical protein